MSVPSPLTERQAEILGWIERFFAEHGFSPTLREIGTGCRIASTNGVRDALIAIEKKGRIRRNEFKQRALVLVGEDPPAQAGDNGTANPST